MQSSQPQLALDECILSRWMRYLLPEDVFLHSRPENLFFKIYLSVVEKHKPPWGLKFPVASHCWKSKSIPVQRATYCLCFPFLLLPLNEVVVILRTALMEKNNVGKCSWLHLAGIKHTESLDLHALLHALWWHESALVHSQSIFVIDWWANDRPGTQKFPS